MTCEHNERRKSDAFTETYKPRINSVKTTESEQARESENNRESKSENNRERARVKAIKR